MPSAWASASAADDRAVLRRVCATAFRRVLLNDRRPDEIRLHAPAKHTSSLRSIVPMVSPFAFWMLSVINPFSVSELPVLSPRLLETGYWYW